MTAIAWPASVKPVDFGFWLENADQSGGPGLAGGEQFIASPGPRWRASGMFQVRTSEQILALRSLWAQLDGRVNDVLLPNFDGQRLSWPVDSNTGVTLHPGNTRNPQLDGTAYEDPEIPSVSEISATVNATAALRATTIAINKTQGEALIAGQQFGIGQRLYEIRTITSVVGNVTTVTIRPPLRAQATATAPVLFTRPVCLMKAADPSGMLKRLQLLRHADLELEFVESF